MVKVYGWVVDKNLKQGVEHPFVTLTAEGYSGERIGTSAGYYEFNSYGIPANRTYTLRVEKTGYKTFQSEPFYVGTADYRFDVELEPVGIPLDRGMLEVYAYMDEKEVVADAEVKDLKVPPDIVVRDKTPLKVLLPPQTYAVICNYNGYYDEKYPSVKAGQITRVDFRFKTILPSKPIIDVSALYNGTEVKADVTCNGYSGITPARFEVEPGTYTIRGTYLGQERTTTITLKPGEYAWIKLQFEKPTVPVELPYLAVALAAIATGSIMIYAGRRRMMEIPFQTETEIS